MIQIWLSLQLINRMKSDKTVVWYCVVFCVIAAADYELTCLCPVEVVINFVIQGFPFGKLS